MNTRANKTQENKSQSVANGVSQVHGSGESAFQFVDNRAELVEQRQLKSVIQRKTEIINHSKIQPYKSNGQTEKKEQLAGVAMEAYLDPQDPLHGTDTGAFERHGIYVDDDYEVDGRHPTAMHLLNSHLGGLAVDENLFPATPDLNAEHLRQAEGTVKGMLLNLSTAEDQEAVKGHRVKYALNFYAPALLDNQNIRVTPLEILPIKYVDQNNEDYDWPSMVMTGVSDSLDNLGYTSDGLRGNVERSNKKSTHIIFGDDARSNYNEDVRHSSDSGGSRKHFHWGIE